MPILEVKGLRKSYGSVLAVEDIGFDVQAGEVFAILGPQGAGKTTTLEMIEGLVPPDAGTIAVDGLTWERDAEHIKFRIGIPPKCGEMFGLLTVEENLERFAAFYPRSIDEEEALGITGLADCRNKLVNALSDGERRRLAIGLGVLNDPDILCLDEPAAGLDPQARRAIGEIVRNLKAMGKTVVLATDDREEAETWSDRVCIIDRGKVAAFDTPATRTGRR